MMDAQPARSCKLSKHDLWAEYQHGVGGRKPAKDFTSGGNDSALAIVELENRAIDAFGGRSLREKWQSEVNTLAVATGAARTRYESSVLVRESLEAQNQAVSGVSIDEEAIDLMTLQRQFQAAARFITVIDEAMQVLLSIA